MPEDESYTPVEDNRIDHNPKRWDPRDNPPDEVSQRLLWGYLQGQRERLDNVAQAAAAVAGDANARHALENTQFRDAQLAAGFVSHWEEAAVIGRRSFGPGSPIDMEDLVRFATVVGRWEGFELVVDQAASKFDTIETRVARNGRADSIPTFAAVRAHVHERELRVPQPIQAGETMASYRLDQLQRAHAAETAARQLSDLPLQVRAETVVSARTVKSSPQADQAATGPVTRTKESPRRGMRR